MSSSMSENPESEPESDPRSSPKADLDAAQDERLMRLSAKARGLPRVAGVYLMKDAAGVVLYVGKATVLPNRVSTYFQSSTDLGPRKSPMLRLIDDFDVLECDGEWEALLLEARLIKDIRPRFNERLVDGKTFPYLAITVRDEFPGVFVTRNPGDARFKGARDLRAVHVRDGASSLRATSPAGVQVPDLRAGDPKRRSEESFFSPVSAPFHRSVHGTLRESNIPRGVSRGHRPVHSISRIEAERHASRDEAGDGGGVGVSPIRAGCRAARPDPFDRATR